MLIPLRAPLVFGALPWLVPASAHACVECRQRVLDTVFADGFAATLALLLLPVAVVLVVACFAGTRR